MEWEGASASPGVGESIATTSASARSLAAILRASFLACFSTRRSRSFASRTRFAVVVFCLPLEAMPVRPLSGEPVGGLERLYVDRLGALVAGLLVVGDLCSLAERLETLAGDAAVMDEEVLAGLVRGDEAEALVVVEPLHGSCCHVSSGVCAAYAEDAVPATTTGACTTCRRRSAGLNRWSLPLARARYWARSRACPCAPPRAGRTRPRRRPRGWSR